MYPYSMNLWFSDEGIWRNPVPMITFSTDLFANSVTVELQWLEQAWDHEIGSS